MDLYSILGLEPGASMGDIKRAYRRLARRFHPEINPGDRAAETMFGRIAEAYETLVDPARRREYDTAGGAAAPPHDAAVEFTGFDFSVGVHGMQASTFTELFAEVLHPTLPSGGARPEQGADLHATLSVPFEVAMTGGERQVVVTRQDACAGCGGRGEVRTAETRCGPCHGTGKVRWARGHMVFTKSCVACQGTGHQQSQRCVACSGLGRQVRSEAVTIRIPAGVHDGARLRVAELGHAGRQGGRNGDLYVTVHVQPHDVFRRDGDDLHVVLAVRVHDALLGARLDVPSLEGPVKLRIPPGTQGAQRFRVRERGAPTPAGTRGDLIVEVRVVLPAIADDRARELVREFGKLYEV